MQITLGILSFLVAVLAILQGFQMFNGRHKKNNPVSSEKLDTIIHKLGMIASRLDDIWDKVNK